jgi:nucleotide-binding universal stress UspA family protein
MLAKHSPAAENKDNTLMAIKSILVSYSGDANGSRGLQLGLSLAKKHGAYLTGAVWHGPSKIESRHRIHMTTEILEMLARREAEVSVEMREGFAARIAQEGDPERSTFLELSGSGEYSLSETARGYDLLVMGSRAAALGREIIASRPDVMALRSGRPVLLAPHNYRTAFKSDSAVFAWDGKRAAARAVLDALPLLDKGAKINVLTVGSKPAKGAGDDIVSLLRKHDFDVSELVQSAGRNKVSDTILRACAEQGAGLLIMGAYEHSKFSEDMLGGVTQDILENADLPVLMSH